MHFTSILPIVILYFSVNFIIAQIIKLYIKNVEDLDIILMFGIIIIPAIGITGLIMYSVTWIFNRLERFYFG